MTAQKSTTKNIDRFAVARAAKAAKKKAVDEARINGDAIDPSTGEILPAASSEPPKGRWAENIAAAVSEPAKPRWGVLDLNAQPDLPKPGWYRATVSEVRCYDKPDVLWLSINVKLDGLSVDPSGLMEALAADPQSRHASRVAEGRRLLNKLARATGVPATGEYENYGEVYEGKRVWARVAIVPKDGVDALVLRSLADRNPDTGEAI